MRYTELWRVVRHANVIPRLALVLEASCTQQRDTIHLALLEPTPSIQLPSAALISQPCSTTRFDDLELTI